MKAATEDPAVTKYTMMGMNRDAVVLAIATYGDVQSKVILLPRKFSTSFQF